MIIKKKLIAIFMITIFICSNSWGKEDLSNVNLSCSNKRNPDLLFHIEFKRNYLLLRNIILHHPFSINIDRINVYSTDNNYAEYNNIRINRENLVWEKIVDKRWNHGGKCRVITKKNSVQELNKKRFELQDREREKNIEERKNNKF